MRNRVLVLAAIAACAGPRPRPPRGEVVFSVTGRVQEGPYRFGRDDLPRLPRRAFRAIAPGSGSPARFEGVAVLALLQDAVELEVDADTVVFHGREGYRAAVPVGALRQLRPVLADQVGDALVGAWRSEAAPLVLAWPNVEVPGIDSDPRMRWWWVPGVTTVELVSWTATYGRVLAVPRGASDDARLGAGAVATQCMGCHRVRGVGGTRGRELTGGGARRDLAAFAVSLREHLKLVGKASAPETSPAAVRQIDAFLRALDMAGLRSEEEGLPPERPSPQLPPTRPRGY
jgi:hypothetical protein